VNKILVILLFFLTSFNEEETSGIYIVVKPLKKTSCENELKMVIDQAKLCISKKPIVMVDEIAYITAIKYDPIIESYYIDIGFSPEAMVTLQRTYTSLPNTQFALVVDSDIVCVFAVKEEIAVKSIRIGQDAPLKNLQIIREILSKVKP
jgi:hypothetical protein